MIHIFIINPFAGKKTFADDLRTKLNEIEGLEYFVFNTRYAGYETELVKKIQHIFAGEKLRFYSCGGSGTMRNMLNGFADLSQAEVAFFPCGLTNDFLKTFGSDMARFKNIEELIYGDIVKVDYIKTNHGVALNTVSVGLDSNVVSKMEQYRVLRMFSDDLPYNMATLYSFFISGTDEYEIAFDDEEYSGRYAEIFFGNGCVLGGNMHFAPFANRVDGKAMYALIGNRRNFRLLPELIALTGENYENYGKLMTRGTSQKMRLRRKDGAPFGVNHDGELIRNISECEAQIVRQGLSLVVPKGVTVC